MKQSYDLILNNKKYQVPKIQEIIIRVSKKVADELLNFNKYFVISTVSEEVFQNFVDYWKDNKKIPIIDHTNFFEYQQLNQEFGMISELILAKTKDPLFNLSFLSNNFKCDKSSIEKSISCNLDLYLEKYSKEMYQIPINSLINIFKLKERVLHNYSNACRFITQSDINQKVDLNLFLLSETIDGREIYKQSPELFYNFVSECSKNGFNNPEFTILIINEDKRQKDPVLQREIAQLILSNNYKDLRDKINKEKITLLQLPDEVTSIPDYAFFKCSTLQKVTTSMKLTSIGKYSFYGCCSLTNIFIPDTVTTIGKSAFAGCSKLEKVKIPKKVKKIDVKTFEGCLSLEEVNFHDSLEEIGENAFYSCTKLKKIIIPDSVTILTDWSFCWCSSLEEVKLPSGLNKINAGVFEGCSKLEKIEIPSSVTEICNLCFNCCSALKRIVIPSNVMSIGMGSFSNCTSLLDASIPQSVKRINENAFRNCSSLLSIKLPASLTSIGPGAFANCSKLNKIELPESLTSIGSDAFNSCSSLTQIQIPSKITSLGMRTFHNCESLERVVFPKFNVNEIDCNCFTGCPKLKKVEFALSSNSILRFDAFDSPIQIKLRNS